MIILRTNRPENPKYFHAFDFCHVSFKFQRSVVHNINQDAYFDHDFASDSR